MSEEVKTRALALLARREHSRHELQQKLLQRQFALDAIAPVLDWLAAENYQSDSRFIQAYITAGINRGYGPVKIMYELKKRGITPALMTEFFPEDEEFWQQQITALWERKFSRSATSWPERAKQMRFFQARGFTHEQIKKLYLLKN